MFVWMPVNNSLAPLQLLARATIRSHWRFVTRITRDTFHAPATFRRYRICTAVLAQRRATASLHTRSRHLAENFHSPVLTYNAAAFYPLRHALATATLRRRLLQPAHLQPAARMHLRT